MQRIIIVLLVLSIILVGGYYGLTQRKMHAPQKEPQTASSNTYTNSKYGYQISYPSSLKLREFPDTGTGAGLRPAKEPSDPQYEVISVNVLPKMPDMASEPLSKYAKIAATVEIQGYQKLNSLKEIKTQSGEVGYETTWLVSGPPILGATGVPQSSISLPITYFALPGANPPATVQISLSDKKYLPQYEEILKTFKIAQQ